MGLTVNIAKTNLPRKSTATCRVLREKEQALKHGRNSPSKKAAGIVEMNFPLYAGESLIKVLLYCGMEKVQHRGIFYLEGTCN